MPRARSKTKKNVNAITHKDKRANIPTEELRDFVAEEEKAPEIMLYPRDPSLDPQLVWKGKDEQDSKDLAVPVTPIYIQEKIHPHALIEDLRAHSPSQDDKIREAASVYQFGLFNDFNGLPEEFDQRVDFYNHEGNWQNRMILGDSLLVMTSLAEKEGLKGKVQCIYIDPPYGIKFGSNWQVSTRKRDVRDGKAEDATRQPEQIRAFRDTWELGIHSYLAYLRDRLVVARELLTETGSVFVQIGDENVHLVRSILDEVFGSENFVSIISLQKTAGAGSPAIGTKVLASTTDFIIWYGRNRKVLKYRQLHNKKQAGVGKGTEYKYVEKEHERRVLSSKDDVGVLLSSGGRLFRYDNLISQTAGETTTFAVHVESKSYVPSVGGWKTNRTGMDRLLASGRVAPRGTFVSYVRYLEDFPASPINNAWDDLRWGFDASDKRYVVETNPRVVERCLLMATDPGDLVLDPTCGSGTTAYVAEKLGRRWITIDTSRVAVALARTRLMVGRFPYYLLADSPEGVKKEAETTGRVPPPTRTEADIKKGFVYKRVPHITLKAIANNEEIGEIHARWQPKQNEVNEKLNKSLKEKWEEWEVPRETGDEWSEAAKKAHAEFWRLHRERQQEIDASIARRADTELLYDQPHEDKKTVRVSGPFTVESLSPHRVLSTADDNLDGTVTEKEARRQQDFGTMILENLAKAGVQNTKKNERLVFDTLEPYAGTWLNAAGTYTDSDGQTKRVAVSIGPEHGTLGPTQVKEAAKEAVQGVGFDLLIMCGFAFDPHVSEEVKRYGKLDVLPTRMNPDLAMGDLLLKKTGAGNLFTVFGEPDVEVREQPGGDIILELKGLDIYDPTTGEIRSSSTEDIACWFVDTAYNGESFFVRHAYFTGADEPYKKLQRVMKAEIDEAAWESIYSTVSRPFPKPETGKIAVKVINHYGDEVLKVFDV